MSFQEKQAQKGVRPAAVFSLSLLFVFLILAALYEKAGHSPSTCSWERLSPFLEAFAALLARHMVNNVYAQIDWSCSLASPLRMPSSSSSFARLEYEKGKALADGRLDRARIRLRPILMTSFAFVFGCIPLWIASWGGPRVAADIGHGRHRGNAGCHLHCHFPDPSDFLMWSRSSPSF